MKKIQYILIAVIVISCSKDSNNSSGSQESISGQGGSLASFTILNDYLYTVDETSLNVFSIVNTEQPVKVNDIPIGFRIETLFNYKENLYIGSRDGMFIYSVHTPEEPTYLADVQHFTSCDPVIANDTHAFVTLHGGNNCGNNINVLEIYDITDVINPTLISSRNLTSPIGIGLYEDYLFVCDDEVKIFDVSNPEESVLVTSIDRNVFDVIINNNLLFLIGENGLYQYSLDENNIENIQPLSTIDF
jgi:hypothetical protein